MRGLLAEPPAALGYAGTRRSSCRPTEDAMRAIVLDHPGSFRVADVPDPTPRAREVVVRVDCCGICGTDLHIIDGEFPPTPYPITPGHEFAGQIVACGPDVEPDLAEGDRVAVDPSLYCGWCRRCRAGRDNLCENWAAIGDTKNGAFAEYVAVPGAAGLRSSRPLAPRAGNRRIRRGDRGGHDGLAAAAIAAARRRRPCRGRRPDHLPAGCRPQARRGPGRRQRRRSRRGPV